MDGGDVDVEGLEKTHRYPTFAGLKICITGIPDQARRNELSSTIEHEGAEYHGDLTKQVTHLLVATPEGAKYKAAKDWRIHTVSLKWLEDSVQRGMALDPRYYDPTMSDTEQGKGAYRREAGPRTTLGKRVRTEERPGNENGKRKLRRHASRRLEDHSQDMWQDISAVDTSAVVAAPAETNQWTVGEEDSQLNLGPPKPRPQIRKSLDARDGRTAEEADLERQGVFYGWRIAMQGFARDKAERLAQYLEPNGAHVVLQLQDLKVPEGYRDPVIPCLLVPHLQPSQDVHIDSTPPGTITATEWWVERCLHYKRILDPEEDVLSQPLWNLNILGFSKLTVSTTGFSGVDYRQVAEAVKLSGATYQEQLNSTISVLVSGSSTVKKEKAYYAAKHQIPVVTADWLWTCLKTKRKASTERFRIELPKYDPNDITRRTSMASPASSDTLARSNSTNTKKDNQTSSRLSNTRRRQTTPSLPLQANRPNPKAPPPAGPFVHEDEDDEDDDGSACPVSGDANPPADAVPEKVVPLQSISANSPRKPSADAAKTSIEHHHSLDGQLDAEDAHTVDQPADDTNEAPQHTEDETPAPLPTPQPPVRPQAEWTADLASLMEKQQRRPSSEHINNPAQRLKHRKLGRAISGSSLASRTNEASTTAQPHHQDTGSKDTSFSESPAEATAARENDLPSTQIGYETPEAEAARRQMAKRMGTNYSDESVGTRLASLGTVRDSAGSGAATTSGGGRAVRTRTRN